MLRMWPAPHHCTIPKVALSKKLVISSEHENKTCKLQKREYLATADFFTVTCIFKKTVYLIVSIGNAAIERPSGRSLLAKVRLEWLVRVHSLFEVSLNTAYKDVVLRPWGVDDGDLVETSLPEHSACCLLTPDRAQPGTTHRQ